MDEEVIKEQEDGLRGDILDLKAQIEESELIYGIPSKGMGFANLTTQDNVAKVQFMYQRTRNTLVVNENVLCIKPCRCSSPSQFFFRRTLWLRN